MLFLSTPSPRPTVTGTVTDSLTACVRLDQEQVSADQTLCHGITFVLDRQRLVALLTAKHRGERLRFAPDFVVAWRRYALFCENNQLQHSWSFTLQYEGEGIFKTLIALDGDVLHQVTADILLHGSLYRQLREVHGWLMEQLLLQLRWQVQYPPLQSLAWGVAIAVVGVTVLFNVDRFVQQPLLIGPAVICVWLVQWGIHRLLQRAMPCLYRYLLQAMMYGLFAKNYRLRAIGLQYLAKFSQGSSLP